MNKTNSAKKLYDIFKNLSQRDGETPVNQVWSEILGADINNPYDISDKIAQVLNLTNDIKEDINSIEIDEEEKNNFLNAVDKIQLFIVRNDLYGNKVSALSIPAYFTDETLSVISGFGTLINANSRGFDNIDADEITSFKNELSELLEKTNKLDIDDRTKNFIARKIKDILNVIDNYQARGLSGLDKVVKKSLGDIFVYGSMHPEQKEKLTDLINTVLKINGLINATEKMSHLLQSAADLFLSGGN
jgi:transcriptional regulator of heat shock response